MRIRGPLLVAMLALLCPALRADVKPHALFSDGMVLQQKVKCPIWGTADPGEMISITLAGERKGQKTTVTAGQDGTFRADFGPEEAGGPYTLTMKGKNTVTVKDVYFGEVWVASGQSNMWWPINSSETPDKIKKAANHPMIRLFTVPQRDTDEIKKDINAKWQPCTPETVGGFSAVCYHFGVNLHENLKVPVGLIHSSWGGTICEAWMAKEDLAKNDEIKVLWERYEKVPAGMRKGPNRPVVLYNGMIACLQPYAIKGAIWYQGESNAGRAYQYRTLFPAMIESWRRTWNMPDMPFYFVQLAPFMQKSKEPQDSAWAELREAQFVTSLNLKNTGMATIVDAGDERDIHPKPKQVVGERLALCARALTYGEKIAFSGPIYDSKEIKGNKVVLSFKQVGKGLEAKGGMLKGFTIAAEDRKFHNAEAVIEGDKVIVSCEKVDKPAAVRYGWANYPEVNLFNKDGLPASPFRTDDWPGVTVKNR
jgi:sialate O-acetylesterase